MKMSNAMTKGARRQTQQKALARRESSVITGSIIILAVLVLICAGMLVPPLWTAVVDSRQFRPSVQDCSMLKDPSARQDCYEGLSARGARHPAKGPMRSPD